jgi:hypothetical protein
MVAVDRLVYTIVAAVIGFCRSSDFFSESVLFYSLVVLVVVLFVVHVVTSRCLPNSFIASAAF